METDPAELSEIRFLGASTVQRIEWLTLAIGLAAALGTAVVTRQWRWVAGLTVGTLLGWVNFRLLRRGAEVLLRVRLAGESGKKPRMPMLAAMVRYGLLGLGVYVSFKYLHVPLVSLMAGLCAFGVATIAASVWAILNPEE
jgi:ATP synthase I chain